MAFSRILIDRCTTYHSVVILLFTTVRELYLVIHPTNITNTYCTCGCVVVCVCASVHFSFIVFILFGGSYCGFPFLLSSSHSFLTFVLLFDFSVS